MGGIQTGYNWRSGSVVLGVETDIQYSGITIKDHADGLRLKWFGTTRLKLGFLRDERMLVYGTAGAAYGKHKVEIKHPNEEPYISKNTVGWTVGAGFERVIDRNWSAKLEYFYTSLGKIKILDTPRQRDEASLYFHTIRVGVNYRF